MLRFVYIYKDNGGDEILWSIRSIKKYCKTECSITVITPKLTDKLKEFSDLIHFKAYDYYGKKQMNAIYKILKYCNNMDEEFVLMNDDFIFLKDFEEIPIYTWGVLNEDFIRAKNGLYQVSLRNAIRTIGKEKPLNFEIHYPIVVNPKDFISSMKGVSWNTHSTVYRSIYGNKYVKDYKDLDYDFKVYNINDFKLLKDGDFMSLSDKSAKFDSVKELLLERGLL